MVSRVNPYRNTTLVKQQFVIDHTVRQIHILRITRQWVTNTPSVTLSCLQRKAARPYIFVKS
jgi:hypothetical protein